MLDTIRLVIAWTCVAVFVATAIITILALVGKIRLPDPKYLNRLFTIIIVAVVGTCASFFKEFISSGTSPAVVQPATNEASPVVTKPVTNAVVPVAAKPRTNGVVPVVIKQPRTNEFFPGVTKPVPEKGWVGFKNSGAYVAKFYVNWKVDGQPQSWASGEKAVGQSGVVSLNGNVSDIKINAQAHTGFKWATIFTLELTNGPPNKTYVVQGTTLDRRWTTDSRMP
jgi:hypothetical protein